jgi:DNA mismatch repair ATPase MutS
VSCYFRLLAFADVAIKHNFVRPVLNDSHEIQIIKGRHPTLDYYQGEVVPNDYMSNETQRIMIVTGANSCGKSVYLKQNCLIIFLAHIGSFVPASFCKLGHITKILTHIYTNDSLETRMGSFAFEARRLQQIINYADKSSFVAIDEFGRSTKPLDGFSLLTSSILYLQDRLTDCPNTIVSTHFYKIRNEINTDRVAFQTFELTEINESVMFKYQIQNGFADEAVVLRVVCKLLAHPYLIERLKFVLEKFKKGETFEAVHCKEYEEEVEQNYRLAKELICYYRTNAKASKEKTEKRPDPETPNSEWVQEQLSLLDELVNSTQNSKQEPAVKKL